MTPHLSTLTLHRFRLGELSSEAEVEAKQHLGACPTCEARIGVQHRQRLAFVQAPVPPAILAADSPPWWSRLRAQLWAVGLVPVAAAVLMMIGGVPEEMAGSWSEIDAGVVETPGLAGETREKGEAGRLEAWLQTGKSSRLLEPGETLLAGARVQLKFHPAGRRFVTLAGRDGSGSVEVYGTLPVNEGGLQTAPFALTLDGSRGPQSFFAVWSDRRPDADQLVAELGRESPKLPGAEVARISFEKE